MKKFLSVLMTLALLFGLAVPVTASAAEESVTVYANDSDKVIAENVLDGYQENHGLYDETSGHYGLKPADATLGDATITFSVDTEVAGRYSIEIFYASSSDGRQFGFQLNDGAKEDVTVASTGDWKVHGVHTITKNLEAGENDIVISTPSGFADGVKTPNIYGIKYTLKEAAKPVAETVTVYANDSDKVIAENVLDGYQENHGLYGETSGHYGLKPADATLGDATITFSIDTEVAGRYSIEIAYASSSDGRQCSFQLNDDAVETITFASTGDWKVHGTHTITKNLEKGENDIVISTPAGFADGVKTPNIYAVKYTLKEAAAEPVAPTTPEEILEAAFALEKGAALDGNYTLTGEIVKIKTPYSEQFKNIEVIIKVLDKELLCYRLKGDGADALAVGDTITVTGKIKNYNGTVEFDTGCTLDAVVKGPAQLGYLGRANSYDWGTNGHANAVFAFASADETATASAILGQAPGTFGWWYAYVLEYNEANGTFVVTVADNVMDGVNAVETATLGYGKLAFMFHSDFANTDADTYNYFLEKATVGTEFYLVGDYDTIVATWDVLADTYLTTVEPENYWTVPVEVPTTPEGIVNAAYELADGKYLADGAAFTLTGVVTSSTFNEQYGDATTYMVVEGMTEKPMMCYQLKGDVANLKEGDIITVTGKIKNYKGTIEFEKPTLDKVESAPEVVEPVFLGGVLGRANSYDWGTNGHANAVFAFASADETATASAILGQAPGTFGWWYAFVLEYNEAKGTFVVTVSDTVMDGVNAVETATLGYGKLAFMFHGDFANTDADTYNYFLEKATEGTEFYLVGDYDAIVATWDVLADTYLTTEKPAKYWTKPVVTPDEPIVVEGEEYVVKKGDTLSEIAAACGLTVKELAEANKIENPDVIAKGTTLIIPKVEVKRHIVVKGDTLSQIAKANGCNIADLVKLNNIANPDLIVRGDVIILP